MGLSRTAPVPAPGSPTAPRPHATSSCKDKPQPPQSKLDPQFDLIKERSAELHYACSRPSTSHPLHLCPKQPGIDGSIKLCLFFFSPLLPLTRGFTSKINMGKLLNSSNATCLQGTAPRTLPGTVLHPSHAAPCQVTGFPRGLPQRSALHKKEQTGFSSPPFQWCHSSPALHPPSATLRDAKHTAKTLHLPHYPRAKFLLSLGNGSTILSP